MSQKILPKVFDIDCVSIGKYSDFWSSYSLISSRNMYTMYFMVIGDLSPGLNILTTCHEFSVQITKSCNSQLELCAKQMTEADS